MSHPNPFQKDDGKWYWYDETHDINGPYEDKKEAESHMYMYCVAILECNGPVIPMILHCPCCHKQHIDKPKPEEGWTNPPHRSHLCEYCGCIWRPADICTKGVEQINSKGKEDTINVCKDPYRETLESLVRLKDYREQFGKDSYYLNMKEEVWNKARELLQEKP